MKSKNYSRLKQTDKSEENNRILDRQRKARINLHKKNHLNLSQPRQGKSGAQNRRSSHHFSKTLTASRTRGEETVPSSCKKKPPSPTGGVSGSKTQQRKTVGYRSPDQSLRVRDIVVEEEENHLNQLNQSMTTSMSRISSTRFSSMNITATASSYHPVVVENQNKTPNHCSQTSYDAREKFFKKPKTMKKIKNPMQIAQGVRPRLSRVMSSKWTAHGQTGTQLKFWSKNKNVLFGINNTAKDTQQRAGSPPDSLIPSQYKSEGYPAPSSIKAVKTEPGFGRDFLGGCSELNRSLGEGQSENYYTSPERGLTTIQEKRKSYKKRRKNNPIFSIKKRSLAMDSSMDKTNHSKSRGRISISTERSPLATQNLINKSVIQGHVQRLKKSRKVVEETRKENSLFKQEIAVLQNEKFRLDLKFKEAELETKGLYKRLQESEETNMKLTKQLVDAKDRTKNLELSLEDLKNLLKLRIEEKVEADLLIKNLREKVTIASERRISVEYLGFQSTTQDQELTSDEVVRLRIESTKQQERVRGLQIELEKLKESSDNLRQKNSEVVNHLTKEQSKNQTLKIKLDAMRKDLDSSLADNARLTQNIKSLKTTSDGLKTKKLALETQVEQLNHKHRRFLDENGDYSKKVDKYQNQIAELSEKVKSLDSENRRLEQASAQQKRKAEVDFRRISDQRNFFQKKAEKVEGTLAEVREQAHSERRRREEVEARLRGLLDEVEKQKSRLGKFEVLNANLKEMTQAMKTSREERHKSNSALTEKIQILELENSGLKAQVESKTKALKELRRQGKARKIEKESQIENLEKSKIQSERQIVELENDIEVLRSKFEGYEERMESQRAQIEKLTRTKFELKAQILELNTVKENTSRENKHLIESNKIYKDKNLTLTEKIQKFENWQKSKSNSSQDNLRLIEELKAIIKNLELENQEFEQKISKVRQERKSLELETINLRRMCEELSAENSLCKQQVEECKLIIREWDEERKRYLEKNQRLEILSRDRLTELEKKTHSNSKLMFRLCLAYAELDRLLSFSEEKKLSAFGEGRGVVDDISGLVIEEEQSGESDEEGEVSEDVGEHFESEAEVDDDEKQFSRSEGVCSTQPE